MPVQIPTIKRLGVPDSGTVGRVQADVPNALPAMQQMQQAGEKVFDVLERAESHAADTEGLKAKVEFNKWNNEQIEGQTEVDATGKVVRATPGLRHQTGDTTQAYADYGKKKKDKFDEIMKRYEGASEKTKIAVQRNLLIEDASADDKSLTYHGHQQAIYKKAITDEAIKTELDKVPEAIKFFDGKNDAPLQAILARIDNISYDYGEWSGDVARTQDGKLIPGAVTKQQIAKAKSEAVYTASSLLLESGEYEKGKALSEKYKDYMGYVEKKKIADDIEKSEVDFIAYGAWSKLEGRPYVEQQKIIDSLPEGTLNEKKAKQKAKALWDQDERERELITSRVSERAKNFLGTRILDAIDKGEPFANVHVLESKVKEYKNLVKRLTPADRQTINKMLEAPKKSDPMALADVINEYGGNFYGVPVTTVMDKVTDLSVQDQKMALGWWRRDNEETSSEKRADMQVFRKLIYDKFVAEKKIETVNGSETKKSKARRAEFMNSMMEILYSIPAKSPIHEKQKLINENFAKFIEKKPAEGGWFSGWFSKPKKEEPFKATPYKRQNAPMSNIEPSLKDFDTLSPEEEDDVVDQYINENPGKEPSIEDIRKWYNEKAER